MKCEACNGDGYIIPDENDYVETCLYCNGTGIQPEEEALKPENETCNQVMDRAKNNGVHRDLFNNMNPSIKIIEKICAGLEYVPVLNMAYNKGLL